MAKTREEREAEERQREEELAAFAGTTLRRSLPLTHTQQQTDASGSNTRLPSLQEKEDNDGNQSENSQLRQLNATPANPNTPIPS
jgi:hypothetical protein